MTSNCADATSLAGRRNWKNGTLAARAARAGACRSVVGVTFAILSTWVIGRFLIGAPWWLWPALCAAYWSTTYPLLVRHDGSFGAALFGGAIFGGALQLISAYVSPTAALYLSHLIAGFLFPASSATPNVWWTNEKNPNAAKDGDIGPLPPSLYVLHNDRLAARYLK